MSDVSTALDAVDQASQRLFEVMLKEAKQYNGFSIRVAILLLHSSSEDDMSIITCAVDHGDDEGLTSVCDAARSIRRLKLLQDGEYLEAVLCVIGSGALVDAVSRESVLRREIFTA